MLKKRRKCDIRYNRERVICEVKYEGRRIKEFRKKTMGGSR